MLQLLNDLSLRLSRRGVCMSQDLDELAQSAWVRLERAGHPGPARDKALVPAGCTGTGWLSRQVSMVGRNASLPKPVADLAFTQWCLDKGTRETLEARAPVKEPFLTSTQAAIIPACSLRVFKTVLIRIAEAALLPICPVLEIGVGRFVCSELALAVTASILKQVDSANQDQAYRAYAELSTGKVTENVRNCDRL